jgi:4-amino-4-deoxy-L-arabinose transferase-like glycosyltransferase
LGQCVHELPDRLILVALFAFALLVRLAFATRAPVFGTKDSFEYLQPAYGLLNGQGFDLALRRPPIYSLFASLSMGLFGESLAALTFVQHLLGALTVLVTYLLGKALFNRPAAVLAALLVALDSVLLFYEHYVLSESLFTLLLAVTCLAFVRALQLGGARRFFLAGLLLGLAILARPVAQSLIVAMLAALALHQRGLASSWRPALVFLLAIGLLVVPWMVRNKLAYGSFSTSGSGRFLSARVVKHDRADNGRAAYRFYDPATASQLDPLQRRARQIFQEEADERPEEGPIYSRYRQELGLGEAEADELLRAISLEGIQRDPAHYLQTTGAMFLDLFAGDQKEEQLRWHYRERNQERLMSQWELGGMRHLLAAPTPAQLAGFEVAEAIGLIYRPTRWLTPLALGMLLAVGLALARGRAGPVAAVALVILVTLAVSAALVGEVPRYRYPLDPLIATLAVGGYVAAAELLMRRWSARGAATRQLDLAVRPDANTL